MERWEYTTCVMYQSNQRKKYDEALDKLNQLGAQGWEAVAVLRGGEGVNGTLLLKRPAG